MEKIYKTMKSSGVSNLVLGIILIVVSTLIGAFMIVNGVKLLKRKSGLIF